MPETTYQVIVHQSSGLQVGIESGGAQEAEASLFHIPSQGI